MAPPGGAGPGSVAELTEPLRTDGYLADRGLATAVYVALVARPAAPARGRGRRRQDRGRQGAGRGARAPADPAPVLRGHRHQPGPLRVGLRPPDAADPGPVRAAARRRGRRSTPSSVPKFLLERPLLDAVRAGDEAVLLVDEVDRADDEFEAFLLELLSDFQITIPEIGTIAAETAAARGAHLQPHPRAARRAQAPLPLPLGRLPGRRARGGDRAGPRCPASPKPWPARSSPPSTGSASSTWTSHPGWPRPSTGSRPSTSSASTTSTADAVEDSLGAVIKDARRPRAWCATHLDELAVDG